MSYEQSSDAARLRHAHAAVSSAGPRPVSGPVRGSVDCAPGDVAAVRLLGGRYRIDTLLGSGGMGTVWRGYDLRLDRPVAIKLLSGKGLRLPKAMERFDREARAVARLSHPNIVPVHDFGTEDGNPYLVMELVDGPTVYDLLDEGPLATADVLAISAQICDGLAAAHTADIVHRDIKPSNLIVAVTGVVKICDFGVARILNTTAPADEPADLTGSAVAMGSSKYMAPEQINGDPVDPRTDLYGLGCSMYAMFTGQPPFSAGNALSVVHQHVTQAPEPLRVRRPDVPPEVEALVAELLAKPPDERPSDATAVRARIAAAADLMAHSEAATLPRSAVSSAMVLAAVPPHSARSTEQRTSLPVDGPESAVGDAQVAVHAQERATRDTREPDVGAAAATASPAGTRPPNRNDGVPAPRPRRRLWMAAAVVAGVVTLTALVTTLPPMNRSGSHGGAQRLAATDSPVVGGPSPSAVRETAAPAADEATARMQTRPSPTVSALLPVDPILALRQAIQRQVDAGALPADTSRDLNHMVDELAKSIATDNPDDETKKLKALRDQLAKLYTDGKLNTAAFTDLSSHVDAVATEIG
ncbi:serine/threonine-protein kinase [Dactylosporangium sp. AC04546]|uniref:serine/threonine-protein kinase n=1 Tax=Dactylosporangium sp. AC04546 TaxID=2862460 RepID=UPI001EDD40B2|nr:serine/threonine-protein kinase [Dactylosporangium sp. AC04546]WVK80575.1 serine/threonine-protein kinase [Dactylosporangium sp. AC04546]